MIGQAGLRYDIQLVETDESPVLPEESRIGTHLAFISDDPAASIEEIKIWTESRHIKFISGAWTDKEQYFDLPDLFVNFVIEILHSSVES